MPESKYIDVHLKMFPEDWYELKAYYPTAGASNAVRLLVRKHLKELKERQKAIAKEIPFDE